MTGEQGSANSGITRRRFVRDAGIATVAVADALSPTIAQARPRRRPRVRRPTVAVFGGGIAGLTAAHELAERGFNVTVYERRAWGGKARSTWVPHSGAGSRKPLPGEHGWRTFFGFYQNTIDTMRRVPFGSNANGVFDNLAEAAQFVVARDNGRQDWVVPFAVTPRAATTPQEVIDLIVAAGLQTKLQPQEVLRFANCLAMFFSSCDDRRDGQWENVRWSEFAGARSTSDDYRRIVVNALSEILQASKAERTSAAFSAHFWELSIYCLLGRGANGSYFRFLDRPTNEAFIDPWLYVLKQHGVRLLNGHEVTRLIYRDGLMAGAVVRADNWSHEIRADWYVIAMPVERARRLWDRHILKADPQLQRMWNLDTGWMNGIKFFLREQRPIANGVVDYIDSPWELTSVSQSQFWALDFASTYGDGRARESLSVIASNWTTPGILYGKPAQQCSPAEIAREVWEQMKRHLDDTGQAPLTDDLLLSWNLDPGMLVRDGHAVSQDPLVLPSVGQLPDRPDVGTAIPNLFLAGDYLRSAWEVASMETACFNGRRAANALLERAGSTETPAATIAPYQPPEWEPLRQLDERRWRDGQPNLFDTDLTLDQLNGPLSTTGTIAIPIP